MANSRIRQQLADRLSSYGYEVRLQGTVRNVIALPRWTGDHFAPLGRRAEGLANPVPNLWGPSLRPSAVCAHYDSVPDTPGADDNASALAVMLEVARLAADNEVPIVAIAFNAEEDDLAGSREFARCIRGLKLPPIGVAHVLEMVGYTAPSQRLPPVPAWLKRSVPSTGDFIGVIANRRSSPHLDAVIRRARASTSSPPLVGLKALWGIERWLPDIKRSDHAPLWRAGISALLWTDTAEFRNPNYHLPTDTPETLNYEFMARLVLLLLGVVGVERC